MTDFLQDADCYYYTGRLPEGRGEPCKRGETAARSGCVPRSKSRAGVARPKGKPAERDAQRKPRETKSSQSARKAVKDAGFAPGPATTYKAQASALERALAREETSAHARQALREMSDKELDTASSIIDGNGGLDTFPTASMDIGREINRRAQAAAAPLLQLPPSIRAAVMNALSDSGQ